MPHWASDAGEFQQQDTMKIKIVEKISKKKETKIGLVLKRLFYRLIPIVR